MWGPAELWLQRGVGVSGGQGAARRGVCGAVPSTGELGKMGWCILFSGKEGPLPMARKSSEMLIIPRSPCPLGGRLP